MMSSDYWRELVLQSGLRLKSSQTLQSLWAGYGSTIEVDAERLHDGASLRVVVKHATTPEGEQGVGHHRKVRSYQVEAAFYRCVAPCLLRFHTCAVPEPLAVHTDESTGSLTLLMTDLRERFPDAVEELDLEHAKAALTWLAEFHAAYMGFDGEPQTLPDGLWEEGSYWHLQTRIDELDAVRAEWPELADAAHEIDRRLSRGAPRTLIHGDAKAPNFLFSRPADVDNGDVVTCAAYDFQYAGGGDGMRDVAYLLCRSVALEVVEEFGEALLRHYHDSIIRRLKPERAGSYSYEFMVERLDVALCDYVRWRVDGGVAV